MCHMSTPWPHVVQKTGYFHEFLVRCFACLSEALDSSRLVRSVLSKRRICAGTGQTSPNSAPSTEASRPNPSLVALAFCKKTRPAASGLLGLSSQARNAVVGVGDGVRLQERGFSRVRRFASLFLFFGRERLLCLGWFGTGATALVDVGAALSLGTRVEDCRARGTRNPSRS